MKIWQTDVLVIGGGLAGIRAAVEARKLGRNVLLVSCAPAGKANNSAVSKGYFAVPGGAGDPDDSPGRHLEDTVAGGCGINNTGLVSAMSANLKDEVSFLLDCGVPLARNKEGGLLRTRVPGHSFPRVMGTVRSSGAQLTGPLVTRAGELGVHMESGITIFSLVKENGRVYGARGCTKKGQPVVVEAGATILATGGSAGLYRSTNNAPGSVGLGQAMALELGLPLVDMEFVQFYPTYLHMPGKPRLMVLYETVVAVAGATLRNCNGQDIRDLHGLDGGAGLTRDRLSRAIAFEIAAGRGVGRDGKAVSLDLSTMKRPEKYRRFIPAAVPPDASNIAVAPVAHFTMGGVVAGPGGETGIPGLWAIGEVAGGIHGANRIGGNALAECLALGRAAGAAASEYSLKENTGERRQGNCRYLFGSADNNEAMGPLEDALKSIMTEKAAILRNASGLQEAMAGINSIKAVLKRISGKESSVAGIRLEMMLDVAGAICLSALSRAESRGSHYRTDHPSERDEQLGNYFVRKIYGELDISFKPLASSPTIAISHKQ